MFKLIYRLWRTVMIAAVGAAIAAKFILESNAEPDTEEHTEWPSLFLAPLPVPVNASAIAPRLATSCGVMAGRSRNGMGG